MREEFLIPQEAYENEGYNLVKCLPLKNEDASSSPRTNLKKKIKCGGICL